MLCLGPARARPGAGALAQNQVQVWLVTKFSEFESEYPLANWAPEPHRSGWELRHAELVKGAPK